MTISAESISSELAKREISQDTLDYFRHRLRLRLHQLVLDTFLHQTNENGEPLTRKELAIRIGKRPEQITRWLGMPGNWTLDTVSDLLVGMGAEPDLERVNYLADLLAPSAISNAWEPPPLSSVQGQSQNRQGNVVDLASLRPPVASGAAAQSELAAALRPKGQPSPPLAA